MDHINYHQEYRQASSRCLDDKFEDILSQHAIVMVDGAHPNLKRSHYIRLGNRLSDVQSNWVNLLCVGLNNSVQLEQDKQYRRVVSNVIKNFTNKLLEMLVEDVHIPHSELVGNADIFHNTLSTNAQRNLTETKRLFYLYVDSLIKLYHSKTELSHQRASVNCFHIAHALGVWLDSTVFT